MPYLRGDELVNIALEAADEALVSVLRRLDDFRGDSRFSTWVYKFRGARGGSETVASAPGKDESCRSSPKPGTRSRATTSDPTSRSNNASSSEAYRTRSPRR